MLLQYSDRVKNIIILITLKCYFVTQLKLNYTLINNLLINVLNGFSS